MRSDLQEPSSELRPNRVRRERRRMPGAGDRLDAALAANAVDAAFADETMPIVTERGSRRDPGSRRASAATCGELTDGALLQSLAEKLDVMQREQTQIRRLLDQAGHLRVDRPAY
jgi:hypothetical protein